MQRSKPCINESDDDKERRETVPVRFTALKIKLQDVRDLAEEKLPKEVPVVTEVPRVQTLEQKNSLIL